MSQPSTSSVINDVNSVVEEASDVVCNLGLDIAVGIENDDSRDAEERAIARFLAKGCSCSPSDGSPCYTTCTTAQLQAACDECRQLTHDELDLVVMGQLRALCQSGHVTQKSKAKNTEHRRSPILYRFGGYCVCQKTCCFLHTMSEKRLKAIKASWMENGLGPRVRANVTPHNITKLSDIKKHSQVSFAVCRRSCHTPSRSDTWLQT